MFNQQLEHDDVVHTPKDFLSKLERVDKTDLISIITEGYHLLKEIKSKTKEEDDKIARFLKRTDWILKGIIGDIPTGVYVDLISRDSKLYEKLNPEVKDFFLNQNNRAYGDVLIHKGKEIKLSYIGAKITILPKMGAYINQTQRYYDEIYIKHEKSAAVINEIFKKHKPLKFVAEPMRMPLSNRDPSYRELVLCYVFFEDLPEGGHVKKEGYFNREKVSLNDMLML